MSFGNQHEAPKGSILKIINELKRGDFSRAIVFGLACCCLFYAVTALAHVLRMFDGFSSSSGILGNLNALRSGANDLCEASVFAYIGIVVILIGWFYQLNKEIKREKGNDGYSLKQIILAWVVPFWNLYMPYLMMTNFHLQTVEIVGAPINDSGSFKNSWLLLCCGHLAFLIANYAFRSDILYFLNAVISIVISIGYYRFYKYSQDIISAQKNWKNTAIPKM